MPLERAVSQGIRFPAFSTCAIHRSSLSGEVPLVGRRGTGDCDVLTGTGHFLPRRPGILVVCVDVEVDVLKEFVEKSFREANGCLWARLKDRRAV